MQGIFLLSLLLAPSIVAALQCSATNKCGEAAPCCSQYGYCGAPGSINCFSFCDPRSSFLPSSCSPDPVCKPIKLDFSRMDRIANSPEEFNNDADKYDAYVQTGAIRKTPQGTILLPITKSGALGQGTLFTSARYMLYGTFSATMKPTTRDGLVSSLIAFSDVHDEIDVEFPAKRPIAWETNVFGKGLITGTQALNLYDGRDRSTNFHTFKVDWTSEYISWSVDGYEYRRLKKSDNPSRFPNTPSRIQMSVWNASPDSDHINTWAGGLTTWDQPEYTMEVKDFQITCYDGDKSTNGVTSYVYPRADSFDVQYSKVPLVFNGQAAGGSSSTPSITSTTSSTTCSKTVTVKSGDTCSALSTAAGISVSQLQAMNPSINSGCSNLSIGQILCLSTGSAPPTTSLTSSAKSTTSTTASTAGCVKSVTVKSGDTCSAIATAGGISVAQLIALNPSVNSGCTNLAIGQVLCVTAGASPSLTTSSTKTSTTSSTVTTSTSAQTGCSKSVTVKSGDTCSAIATASGITISQLLSLNPSVNSGCTNLAIGQVLCVTAGLTSTTSAATITPTKLTSSTVQTVTTGCSKSVTVKSGDTCAAIASASSISTAQLLSLNSAVNSGCTNLAIGQVLCVSVGSGTSTRPTSSLQGTTTSQPAPQSTGCSKSVIVKSGDTCSAIGSANSLTVESLLAMNPSINTQCSNLQIGQSLCVAAAMKCNTSITVVSGDTCSGLSAKYGIAYSKILSLNPSINSGCTNLYPGQVLCLSSGLSARSYRKYIPQRI